METNPGEIRFECPKCRRPITVAPELLNDLVECPGCGTKASPARSVLFSRPSQPPRLDDSNPVLTARESNNPARAIKARARHFELFSKLFFIGAVLVMGLAISVAILGPAADGLVKWAQTFFGLGFVFYVIAQLVHIRANTEK